MKQIRIHTNLKHFLAIFQRYTANNFLMKSEIKNEDVEWAYAFDVHLNAYFPALMILHAVQFFFYHGIWNQT